MAEYLDYNTGQFGKQPQFFLPLDGRRIRGPVLSGAEGMVWLMSQLEQWFHGWRQHDEEAFHKACEWLWDRLYPVVRRYLMQFVDDVRAQHLAADAFWDALEELDLMISGGRFLSVPISKDTVRGRVSGRELGRRDPAEWRGEEAFVALVRRIWILRCRDRLNQWDRVDAVEEGIAEEIPGEMFSPVKWLLDREGLLQFIRDLARASEQLAKYPACREVVEATIIYLKWKVAECNPYWQDRSLDEIATTPIEILVKHADLGAFDADGTEWRQFLMDMLQLNRAALDQRIKRCRKVLIPIMRRLWPKL